MRPDASRGERLRLFLALRLVALTRFLVPRRHRDVWLAEWRAELLYLSRRPSRAADEVERSSRSPAAPRTDVLAYSLHAIPHATAHFKHRWSPEMLLQEMRHAVRRLGKAPGFTVVAMLTVAIGVGANTAIFSVIDSTLLHPLPFPDSDRLVFLWTKVPEMDLQTTPGADDVKRWRQQATSFEDIQVYASTSLTLTGGEEPLRLIGLRVLPGFFGFLGMQPSLGREFSEEEGRLEARVAILGHGLWRSHFGAAGDVLGRTLSLDDERYTVIGVMPPGFHFQAPFEDVQVWLPLSIEGAEQHTSPFAIARLADGVTREAANAEFDAIAAAAAEETGEEVWPGRARRPQDLYGANFDTSLFLLQAAVAMVLLIACANVANLLLARGAGQGSEMAVRAAIGASRGTLFRQLLTEHLLLALGGGVLGYGLARGAVAGISVLRPEQMTALAAVRVDAWVFLFAIGVAALTGLLFGLVPALQASRPDLAGQLQQGARSGSDGPTRFWVRHSLVVAEVALALVLLVGAGLLLGSLSRLLNVDLGFDTDNVLAMSVSLPEQRYSEEARREAFHEELTSRIRRVAGARLEGIGTASGPLPTLGIWFGDFAAEDEEPMEAFRNVAAHMGAISPGFLETLGVPLVDGRYFRAGDVEDPDSPVIVNATWARRMWGDERAVGRRIRVDRNDGPSFFRVVGVIEDVMLVGPTGSLGELQIFRPQKVFSYVSLVIRTVGDPLPLANAFKEQVWAIDSHLPIENVARLDQIYAGRLASQRFNVILLGSFAAIALVLALVGVYGVLSYGVGRRTQEIGIRMALGAQRGDVVPMIAWQGMRMVLVGVVIGVLAAFALTRFMESLLYEVSAVDPLTYFMVSIALMLVATLACLIPAWRAARLDAVEALRQT